MFAYQTTIVFPLFCDYNFLHRVLTRGLGHGGKGAKAIATRSGPCYAHGRAGAATQGREVRIRVLRPRSAWRRQLYHDVYLMRTGFAWRAKQQRLAGSALQRPACLPCQRINCKTRLLWSSGMTDHWPGRKKAQVALESLSEQRLH